MILSRLTFSDKDIMREEVMERHSFFGCGSAAPRISAASALNCAFNAENEEIRRGPQRISLDRISVMP